MTVYAESSSVLRWLLDEADEIHGLLRGATKVVCSRLTLVETRRVIRRAIAEMLLDEVGGTAILEVLARAAAGWAVLEMSRDVAERAEGSFPVEPVRHSMRCTSRAPAAPSGAPRLRLLSSDDRVRANGRRLGFEVLPA